MTLRLTLRSHIQMCFLLGMRSYATLHTGLRAGAGNSLVPVSRFESGKQGIARTPIMRRAVPGPRGSRTSIPIPFGWLHGGLDDCWRSKGKSSCRRTGSLHPSHQPLCRSRLRGYHSAQVDPIIIDPDIRYPGGSQ